MPEQDKERQLPGLQGETTITTSSDEAIIASIEELKRERAGLPDPEIVLDGETLSPESTTSMDVRVVDQASRAKIVDIKKLTHRDSALGLLIWKKARRAA